MKFYECLNANVARTRITLHVHALPGLARPGVIIATIATTSMPELSIESAPVLLTKRSVADALRSWAITLGCPVSYLEQARVVSVQREFVEGEREVRIFTRGESAVVSMPSAAARDFALGDDEINELVELARSDAAPGTVVTLRGTTLVVDDEPASVSVLDYDTFRAATNPARAAMVFDPRLDVMDMLRHEVSAAEWEKGGGLLLSPHRVGALAGGVLVALATVSAADGHLARIHVIVAPNFRRRGLGRLVLQALAKHVLSEGLLPFARIGANDVAARALAGATGFVAFARALTIRITAVPQHQAAHGGAGPVFA